MNTGHKKMEKYDLKLKRKSREGLVLQLHHTVRGSNGKHRKIRFLNACFHNDMDLLACADCSDNIFILDFNDCSFWKLENMGLCSALQFNSHKRDMLAIATNKYEIEFINIETGMKYLSLTGHMAPIKSIAFSNKKNPTMLTASAAEAILWETRNFSKIFTLNTFVGAQIRQILFSPLEYYLIACFQNDTIQIWKRSSMETVKQIVPNSIKNIKTLALTVNGRLLAMAGYCKTLILFSMEIWKAVKTIDLEKYGISGALQIAFIPESLDGGSNTLLAILGQACTLYILNCSSLKVIKSISPPSSGIKKIVVSHTGKYLSCILHLGEINIYSCAEVLSTNQVDQRDKKTDHIGKKEKHNRGDCRESKTIVEQKVSYYMDTERLKRILLQYGEYPEKYRAVIWRSLLKTPTNKHAYCALVDKGFHPTHADIGSFTIHSKYSLMSLKRLLSCLTYWTPLFGVIKYLPSFVFPFVKILKDPLFLFESVATILVNYCQLWFEYAPFPPVSVLVMVENILAEHDKLLLEHYCKIGVTYQTYALIILQTAFSEVLNSTDWMILWDHILSNEPAFILMAVVAFNISQRNIIMKLKTEKHHENFFHMQSYINKKIFLKRIYYMLKNTSADIHPRRFLRKFSPLSKGECYQPFTDYPQATIFLKLSEEERKFRTAKRLLLKPTNENDDHNFETNRNLAKTPSVTTWLSDDTTSYDDVLQKYGYEHQNPTKDCQNCKINNDLDQTRRRKINDMSLQEEKVLMNTIYSRIDR